MGDTVFSVFKNKTGDIHLIVSGIGAIKSACASTYLFGKYTSAPNTNFLNIGVAGSAAHNIGQLVLANKITSDHLNHSFYPSTFYFPRLTQDTIITVDQPKTALPKTAVYDMEAAGFFTAANQCVTQEQVHCVKIISDNSSDDLKKINPSYVETLIQDNISIINDTVEILLGTSQREYQADNPIIDNFKQRWHFTQYQTHELEELLRRWAVIKKNVDALKKCVDAKNVKDVLYLLRAALEQAKYSWT